MNRANAPKQALNKATTKKTSSLSKKAKKVEKKKVATKPARSFRTSAPQRSALYTHLETFTPTQLMEETKMGASLQPDLSQLRDEGGEVINVVPHFEASTDINRRTTFTIFKPCKNQMQNEKNDAWSWRIREDRGRGDETNLLAGDDYYGHDQGIYPEFFSQNDAIEYCKANNFNFIISPEPMRRYDLRSYADNFTWKGLPKKDDV